MISFIYLLKKVLPIRLNDVSIEQILPNLSFEDIDDEGVDILQESTADIVDIICRENKKVPKKRYTWVTEDIYDDLEEALEHIDEMGFVQGVFYYQNE